MLSHFHDDRSGRLEGILDENGLKRLGKEQGAQLAAGSREARYAALRQVQYLDNTMVMPGDRLEDIWDLGGVTMQILNSRYDLQGHEVDDLDENNIAVAAMVQYRGFTYLHQADIYAKTENVLLQRFGDTPSFWDVDVLQGNHHFHGSVGPTFLRLTNPELVTVQVSGAVYDRGAYTTLYRRYVEQYLKEHGADLRDTILAPQSGTLVIDVNSADDWCYSTYKNVLEGAGGDPKAVDDSGTGDGGSEPGAGIGGGGPDASPSAGIGGSGPSAGATNVGSIRPRVAG